MKAISLWEPWATAMRLGPKSIETRGWHTSYRGPLLICAAKRRVKSDIRDVLEEWKTALPDSPLASLTINDLHFGYAVCTVDLYSCEGTEALRQTISPENYWSGNYEAGRFGWITANLQVIDPFPVRGKQGFFNVDIRNVPTKDVTDV